MKYFAVVFVCLFTLQAHAKSIAILIVSNDRKVDQELLDDTTESVMFRITKTHKLNVIPKERFEQLIEYKHPRKPGACFYGEGNTSMSQRCLQEAVNKTKAIYAIIVRVIPFKGTHKLELHVIRRGNAQSVFSTTRYTVNVREVRSFMDACALLIMDEVKELNKPRFHRIVRRIDFKERRHQRAPIDWGSIAIPSVTTSNKPYYTWSAVGSGVLTASFSIAAIVIGAQAKSAEEKIQLCATQPCPELQGSARDDFIADGESKTTTANVMIGLASAFAISTTVLAVLSAYEDDPVDTIPSLSVTPLANGAQLNMSLSF